MLEVIKVETSNGAVECWMDIGIGLPPQLSPITSSLKLGQDLTFTINLKQTNEKWDVNILRCYAYDDTNYDAKSTKVLQISDANGCSLQTNIFGEWKKLETKFALGNTLTYYNTLKVFKFPDRSQVFLKCDIELCSGVCQRKYDCHSNLTLNKNKLQQLLSTTESPRIAPKTKCDLGSTDPACYRQDFTTISSTTRPSKCYPGSSHPECEHYTKEFQTKSLNSMGLRATTNLNYSPTQKSTKAPAYLPPLNKKQLIDTGTINGLACNTRSNDPRCGQTTETKIKTTSAISCNPGSTNPKCRQTNRTINTAVSSCIPNSTNSNCQTTDYGTTSVSPCYPGSTNKKCAQKSKPNCYRGSNDPTCQTGQISLNDEICYPGSTDSSCRQKIKSTKAPEYLPPRDDTITRTTTTSTTCYTGSTDPLCSQTIKTKSRPEATASTDTRCYPGSTNTDCLQESSLKPSCSIGSTDPACLINQKATTVTTLGSSKIAAVESCYPGSTDPKCSKAEATTATRCNQGTNDSNCLQNPNTSLEFLKTAKAPAYLPPTNTERGGRLCNSDSNPSCAQATEVPTTSKPTIKATTVKTRVSLKTEAVKSCYPGSLDPRCPQAVATTARRCNEGSSDPNCLQNSKTSSEFLKTTKGPAYLPPINTERGGQSTEVPSTSKPICSPGSKDFGCLQINNTNAKSTTKTKTTPELKYNTGSFEIKKNDCSLGSGNSKCQPTTYSPSKQEKAELQNTLPDCYDGSTDPRCAQKSEDLCQPGSKELNCITKVLDKCPPGSQDPQCLHCFPGSPDPICPNQATTKKPGCVPGSKRPQCQPATYLPPSTTRRYVLSTQKPKTFTLKPGCYTGSQSPKCQESVLPTTLLNCYPGSTDQRCPKVLTKSKQDCYPDSQDPKCQTNTYLPPNSSGITTIPKVTNVTSNEVAIERPKEKTIGCYPGSSDSQCKQITKIPIAKTTPDVPTTLKPDCYPGSKSSKCQLPTYLPPSKVPGLQQQPSTATPSVRCYPGSLSPQCIQTTRAPIIATTLGIPICYPGSKDPKCPQVVTTTKRAKTKCSTESLEPECLNCFPGSQDPRCPEVPTTNLPTTKATISGTTVGKPRCYPGTKDVRCPQTTNVTTKPIATSKCLAGSSDPICTNKLSTPNCYTGSTDPRCVNTTQKPKSTCYPGSPEPKCSNDHSTADCYPGSKSPKCQPAKYLPPPYSSKTTQQPKVTNLPFTRTTKESLVLTTVGNPSSKSIISPNVQKTNTKCLPGSLEPECLNCFPGSPDPRCPKVATTAKPGCYPGSPDAKCQSATYLPPITAKTTKKTKEVSFNCYQGSTDSRCKSTTPPSGGTTTTIKIPCYPGSSNPICTQTTRKLFSEIKPTTTTPKTNCLPGSLNPQCFKCYPDSLDPRCSKLPSTTKPGCYPGSSDPICQPATYLPPPATKNILKTTLKPNPRFTLATTIPNTQAPCSPGSLNPSCGQTTKQFSKSYTKLTTTKPKTNCSPGSSNPECLNCYPGSKNPRCSEITTTPRPSPYTAKNIPRTTPKVNPVSTLSSNCFPGSTDSNCKEIAPTTTKPGCQKGSNSLECQSATYLPPINTILTQKTTPEPCYPGSTASNCNKQQPPTQIPVCYPGSLDTRCSKTDSTPLTTPTTRKPSTIKPTSPYYCHPGSTDPRCPDAGYKGTSLVPATYLPPLNDIGYDRTIRASKLNLLNGINQLALNDDVFIDLDYEADELEEKQSKHARNKRDVKISSHKQSEKQIIYLTVGVRNAFTVA